ncbi:hypothetical protein BaRGS_00015631 [Batillaria attramentaria]|uniref:non-specific serine/threonine protein kinase n=1 Tax=Batillaria attramentaria TaxID=370345 RepID=A0ABD0L151_9CAEN|nr:hypothetical protein BaRGS_032096 [Batillaria attramentaria]
MIRKEPERGGGGRRPLLATFVGNNRQMLNEIRDSLSHLRKLEGDGEVAGPGGAPLKSELSQSTPNLADKSAAGAKKGLESHHKTLAEIRDSLRPFQTGNRPQAAAGDSEVSRQKIQQVMALGVDEDIAVRALKLSRDVNGAVELLCRIIEGRNLNGSAKVTPGLPSYPVTRRPSFESKYGPSSPAASETNSVRSDSPSLSSVPSAARQPLLNGHQTPPPLPPRAPITQHAPARGHTPPPPMSQVGGDSNGGAPSIVQQVSASDVPHGRVQQLIKRMSPGQPPNVFRSQLVQPSPQTPPPSASNTNGTLTVGGMVAQRGVSPITNLNRHTFVSHPGVPSPTASGSSSASSTPAPSGPRVTIVAHPPPPPYLQAQVAARGGTPTLVHLPAEQSHLLGPQLTEYLAMAPPDSPLNMSTASSSAASMLSEASSGALNPGGVALGLAGGKVGPGYPVVAARRAMGSNHAPIIMQSVKSKEVHKPVPQTATAPMSPPPNITNQAQSTQSYISQVQTTVNASAGSGQVPSPMAVASVPATTSSPHTGNVKIQITRQAHHHQYMQNGLYYATEPQQQGMQSRPTIQINFPGGSQSVGHGFGNHVQIQNFHGVNYDFYQRAPSDTISTPRSDSPVSRTTNQSPLSVMSTTSSPSTNSDIPDKPPPPYPFSLQAAQRQPPIPPRIPLQNKPPPPPPPMQHGVTLHLPARHAPMSTVPASAPSPSPAPAPPIPVSGQNGQASSVETASEQGEDTDTETVSSSEAGATSGPEKHRCLSPMPQRKPEAWERDKLRRDTKVRNYSPQAFKFFMEQHVENVLKIHQQRMRRRMQLENEMAKVQLSEEAARQMRRMLHQKESNYIRLKRAKMDKAMFEKIKTLGVGAFGEVNLVRKRDTGMLYAMKTLRKSDVLKRNQVAHVKAERDILAEADNEWVVKLYYSFQDHQYLYFVMDYVPGGDLMGLLIRMEILEEPLARFYVAELVQAIESVHRMGFIHRDIKPDNILIDRNGHIKLTDFGLCTGFRWTHNSKYYQRDGTHARQDSMEVKCQLDEQCQCEILKPLERRRKREQRCLAHSLVGTPNYIAPEVLLRSAGYTSVCDWWSVGVILYEMLVGHPPFYAKTPAETQYKVINWKDTLKIPREPVLTQAAKDLISRLCCGPEDRLGVNGAVEIKAHPFFEGIDFDSLRRQRPPYVPNIRYATDTSNFDPVDPDKLHNSDSEDNKKVEKLENGKHPEHAFFEFTFRRFFDDGGHPMAPNLEDPDSNSPVYV